MQSRGREFDPLSEQLFLVHSLYMQPFLITRNFRDSPVTYARARLPFLSSFCPFFTDYKKPAPHYIHYRHYKVGSLHDAVCSLVQKGISPVLNQRTQAGHLPRPRLLIK